MDPIVLITRPEAEGRRFAAELRARMPEGWTDVIAPLLEIVPTGAAMPEGIPVFTSAQAVALAGPGGGPAWCVGPRTAAAADAAGWAPRPGGGDADALVGAILAAPEEGPLVHARGAHARGEVAARLAAAGREVREAVLYDQVARPPGPGMIAALAGGGPVVVPLFSPRSAALFAAQSGNAAAPLRLVALSGAVADAAGREVARIAARPDGAAMLDAVETTVRLWDRGNAR